MERAACYVRVSTVEQAEHGVSLDAQEAKLRAYCALHDLEAVVVRDEGVSAFKKLEKRPGGAEVLRLIARREVKHVVVWKFDRLCRNTIDALERTSDWDKRGVALHIVDHGGASLDTSSATGRVMLTLLAGFSQFERDLVSERVRAALAYKREQGRVFNHAPFGLVRDGDRLRESHEEMQVVARIQSLHREGVSVRKIAARLNAEGVPAKMGGAWSGTTVHRTLRRNQKSEVHQ